MSYHLVKDEKHQFTVKHPDGSHFFIAKAGLDQKVLSKIKKLPTLKMADGGEVPEPDEFDVMTKTLNPVNWLQGDPAAQQQDHDAAMASLPTSPADDPSSQPQNPVVANPADNSAPSSVNPSPPSVDTSTPPALPQPSEVSTHAPGSLSSPSTDPSSAIDQIVKGQTSAIKNLGAAKAQESKDTAAAIQNWQTEDQARHAEFQKQYAAIDQDLKQTQDAYSQGKIDPNRLWNNAGTGNQISAGIGLVLSGIGSGLTGQPNAALQILQKKMDQDVEAQKMDMDKKKNLFSMNMDRYKNVEAAEAATRLQLNQGLQAQIQLAGAKSGSAQAQAQAKIAIGQLQMQMLPYKQQLALNQVKAKSLGAGSGEGGLPVGGEPMALLSDPKYQEKRIVIGKNAYQASSPDDAKDLKNMQANYEPVRRMVNRLDQLGPSAALPNTQANMEAQGIRAQLVPMLNKMHGLNRLSESDIDLMGKQIKDPTKFSQLLNGGIKNTEFLKNLNEDLESNYKTRLIGYKGLDAIPSRKSGW